MSVREWWSSTLSVAWVSPLRGGRDLEWPNALFLVSSVFSLVLVPVLTLDCRLEEPRVSFSVSFLFALVLVPTLTAGRGLQQRRAHFLLCLCDVPADVCQTQMIQVMNLHFGILSIEDVTFNETHTLCVILLNLSFYFLHHKISRSICVSLWFILSLKTVLEIKVSTKAILATLSSSYSTSQEEIFCLLWFVDSLCILTASLQLRCCTLSIR